MRQLMHKCIVLKTVLKFTVKLTLKQLRHVSVQSHHHQGAHYSCLLASTNNALPDDGATAPKHVGAVLMLILMLAGMNNTLPDDGVTALKHVGAVLIF